MDFNWFGERPAFNVDAYSFSIIFKGKLTVPLTDDYTFTLDTDGAVSLMINDQIIIDHFMSDREKGWNNE